MSAPFAGLLRFWGLPEPPPGLRAEPGEPAAGHVVLLELGDELRPPWLAAGEPVPLWLAQRPARRGGGRPRAHVVDGDERLPAVVEDKGAVVFLLDPESAVEALLREDHVGPRRPLHTRLRLPYQRVPGPLRLALFRLLRRRERPPAGPAFPSWPDDASVEALRYTFLRAFALAGGQAAPRPFWPAGRGHALAVSHDVDTAAGLRAVPGLAEAEERLGVRSTWFVVGDVLERAGDLFDGLRRRGHEVALHGDRHDNTLAYAGPEGIAHRLDACAAAVARHGVRGFRSPSLLETPELRSALAARFGYASEVPDTEVGALTAPRRGCCTSFPFRRGGLLEVPLTLPMEDKLVLAGLDEQGMLEAWRRKAARVKQRGGLVQLAVHAEPHLLSRCRQAEERLLGELAADGSAWRATLREIARWWTEGRTSA